MRGCRSSRTLTTNCSCFQIHLMQKISIPKLCQYLKVKHSLLRDEDKSEAEDNREGRHWKGHFHIILGLHVTEHLLVWQSLTIKFSKITNPGKAQTSEKVAKTFLNISSTSGMRSRRHAPMKTPPEKQDENEMTERHLYETA